MVILNLQIRPVSTEWRNRWAKRNQAATVVTHRMQVYLKARLIGIGQCFLNDFVIIRTDIGESCVYIASQSEELAAIRCGSRSLMKWLVSFMDYDSLTKKREGLSRPLILSVQTKC